MSFPGRGGASNAQLNMKRKNRKHQVKSPVSNRNSHRPLGKAPLEGGYKAIILVVFLGAILITIHTIYLSDHTIGWTMPRVCSFVVVVFLLAWGGWWYFCRKSDVSFGLAFSTGSFLVWGVLALNYYLADWDQDGKTITPKIEQVGQYHQKRNRPRHCYVDIVLQDKVKRIDFPDKKYEILKKQKNLSLEVHDGFLGFSVFKVKEVE